MYGGPRINIIERTEEVSDGSVQETVGGETQESNDATFIYLEYEPLSIATRANLFSQYLDDNKAFHQTRMSLFITHGDEQYNYICFDIQAEAIDFLADPCPFDKTANSVTFKFGAKEVYKALKLRLDAYPQKNWDTFSLSGKMEYSPIEGEVGKEYSICIPHLSYVDVRFKQGSPVVTLKRGNQSFDITQAGEIYSLKVKAQESST